MSKPIRPNYVHCALTGFHDGDPPKPVRKTWCGRTPEVFEWTFTDASHAILNAMASGRAMLCSECSAQIKGWLKAGTHRPHKKKTSEKVV